MKKNLLIAVVFLGLTVAQGQTNIYHPFPDSNAIWRVNSWAYCSPNTASSYYQYTIGRDTIIGSFSYKKIYKSGMFSTCPNYTVSVYNYYFIGGLRQDIANKKIYFKPYSSSCPDTLIYDFSKQVGDTLNYINCITGYSCTISSIDSVLVGNNYRKQFHLQNGIDTFSNTIIEGIGATSGLLEPFSDAAYLGWDLVCFNHDTDIYPNSAVSCTLITGLESLDIDNRIIIYPNPTNEKIFIDIPQNIKIEIGLLDIYGKKLKSTQQKEINVQDLPAGIYFLQLKTEQGTVNKKLIVTTQQY